MASMTPLTPMTREREIVGISPLFDDLDSIHLDAIAAHGRIQSFPAQQPVITEGAAVEFLHLLVTGRVQLSFRQCGDNVVASSDGEPQTPIQSVGEPGHAIGWSSMVEPYLYRASGVTVEPSELLAIDRRALDDYCVANPEFGVAFMRRVLVLLGNRIRTVRIRLIAGRYEDEVVAVQAALDQSAEILPVTSPLHKLLHYLRNRLTLGDAFHVLEVVQERGEESERGVARLCLEILGAVRKETQLYQDLQRVYQHVAEAPSAADPGEVRRRCCLDFIDLFDRLDVIVRGEEHLPDHPGFIVVMNHLKNHPENTPPNEFQLTLDTHFVSSVILFRKYGDAPIRVVRQARPNEFRHKAYYDRLGYLYVYRGHFDTDEVSDDSGVRRHAFLDAARDVLRSGSNLVICPEGTSTATEQSPTTFRSGAFRLAAYVRLEPLILPIAVANFDKRITRTRVAAIAFPAFRLSDLLGEPLHQDRLHAFLESYRQTFRGYVEQAITLASSQST